ncbi:DUF1659 domain-containing protein [Clostridium sp. D2Q-14]|uniref:DUF1659 domain-containing protein n=1 Tax=Anaeromonas gelatinilytica TaxID=2683194 RepID=UPI00193B5AB0|nr:DUF1659 domain-containing protein [Anaeromonas gelatinilytica]MBS4535797.1 DUF1659 domain-containing protein [Anaeromonas gelatinilytica]
MAVNSILTGSKVKMELHNGQDDQGKDILKSKTFSSVKTDATNEGAYNTISALSGLQSLPLVSVKRIDETELTMGE